MLTGIHHTHYLVVTLFLLIYVIKTILLLSNKHDLLASFTKKVKVPEMIISFLFLLTGIYLTTKLSFGGKYDSLFFTKIALVLLSIPVAIIGFKKSNKIMAALSLVMIVASFGLAEVYHKKKATPAADISGLAANDGKALYEKTCVMCHGNDGKMGLNGAKDLTATTMSVDEVKQIILNGKGMMPPAAVNEEQAAAIADYVKSGLSTH